SGPRSGVLDQIGLDDYHRSKQFVIQDVFEKQKLTGINFREWYRNLRIVLSVEDTLPFLEQPKPAMPVPAEGQVLPPDVLNTHTDWVKALKKIAGLMFMTMDADIQKNLEHLGAYDMLKKLKTLYVQQADWELLQTMREFHACKQEEGKTKRKKSHKAAKGNQGKGKEKMAYAPVLALPFAPKPKNPLTPKKDNPAKDAICHQCGEVGLKGSKKLKPGALSLYVDDGHRVAVEAIG
nr:zinc finger, CCHC-type [Tanacetum cinerariifolium]